MVISLLKSGMQVGQAGENAYRGEAINISNGGNTHNPGLQLWEVM